jgi:hypothetical protein
VVRPVGRALRAMHSQQGSGGLSGPRCDQAQDEQEQDDEDTRAP